MTSMGTSRHDYLLSSQGHHCPDSVLLQLTGECGRVEDDAQNLFSFNEIVTRLSNELHTFGLNVSHVPYRKVDDSL